MTNVLFQPSSQGPFQFQVTLDGNNYNCIILWSLYGQRWYLQIQDLFGNLILYTALIGSPPNYNINLVFGIFTTSVLYFIQSTQTFVITP